MPQVPDAPHRRLVRKESCKPQSSWTPPPPQHSRSQCRDASQGLARWLGSLGEGRGLPRPELASELRRRRRRSSTFPGAEYPETLCSRATSAEVQGHSDPGTDFHCTSSGPVFPPISCKVSRIYPRRPSLPISGGFSRKNKLRNGGMLSQSSVCGSLTGPVVIPWPCQGFDPNEYGNQFWSKKHVGKITCMLTGRYPAS